MQIVREVYGRAMRLQEGAVSGRRRSDSVYPFPQRLLPANGCDRRHIATGTDVKPLEVLLFMRDVRSRGYYEQMKGRGVRMSDLNRSRKVSNSADSAKTRFVLIDAVGVEKSLKTESRRWKTTPVPLKDLLLGRGDGLAMKHRVNLANRLVRMAKQLDDKPNRVSKTFGGTSIAQLGKRSSSH